MPQHLFLNKYKSSSNVYHLTESDIYLAEICRQDNLQFTLTIGVLKWVSDDDNKLNLTTPHKTMINMGYI